MASFSKLLFDRDDLGVGAELTRDVLDQLAFERLVDGDEDALHQQGGDQVLAANVELFGEVLDADAFGDGDGRVIGSGSREICAPPKRDGGWKPFIGPSLVFS